MVASNASFDRAHSAPGACRNHVLVFTQEWECAMEAYAAFCGNGHLFGLHFHCSCSSLAIQERMVQVASTRIDMSRRGVNLFQMQLIRS